MYIETNLEGLNEFIKAAFKEEVIPLIRLKVEIQPIDITRLGRTYPSDLAVDKQKVYDVTKDAIERSGNKLEGIKAYRAVTGALLTDAKVFVEKWFPNWPLTGTGRD